MSYQKELEKICGKYTSKNECYASEEYKRAYPRLIKLYRKEGLHIKRKNLLRNRKRLRQDAMESLFAVK